MRRIQSRTIFDGEFSLYGDKSITHRAIMLNGGLEGEAVLTNASVGADCLSTCQCLRQLGAKVEVDGATMWIQGAPQFQTDTKLYCGNSGTTMRLLAGYLAGKGVNACLYGDDSLSKRPMQRVALPLSGLGANIKTTDGRAPIYIEKSSLMGAEIVLPVASAQVKSAVLLAGLFAEGETFVTEPIKSRDHTERMLMAMGADLQMEGNTVRIKHSCLHSLNICIPSDISSAAYLMALGALKGETLCKNVGINPTRTGILKAFDRLGVAYKLLNECNIGGEPRADILVRKSYLRGITLTAEDIPSMIDELPLIALLCAFADGESMITGAQELRVKESDRILATAQMINALGGDCEALEDGFYIRGKSKLQGGDINSMQDHRIAMAGTIGLLASEAGGNIYGEECCAVSFPDFFEKLDVKND